MSSYVAWPSVVGLVVAVAAFVLSVINYVEARETRVAWRIERHGGDDRQTLEVRLVNESRRFAAVVMSVDDPHPAAQDPENGSISTEASLFPATVEPGNWITVSVWQYHDRPQQQLRIRWRQRRATGRWVRPVVHEIVLFR